jgi:hypothetical protein
MAAIFSFYDGATYEFVKSVSAEILAEGFENKTEADNASGKMMLEVVEADRSFMESLRENSHFVSFTMDGTSISGGLLDDAFCNDNVCSLKYSGWGSTLDKIIAFTSYHSTDFGENIVIREDDKSFEKTFQADCPEGLMWESFNNLEEYMLANGQAKFWQWDGIIETIAAKDTSTWSKSYRLNSAEFPTMKTIYDEILSDGDCQRLKATIDTSDNKFKWVLTFINTNINFTVNTAVDPIYDVQFEFNGIKARRNSLAKGQTIDGETVISRIPFVAGGAFSDYVADNTTNKSTADAVGINRRNIASLKQLIGQVSYKTMEPAYAQVPSVVSIQTDTRSIVMAVSEVSFNGTEFTVSGNATATTEDLNKLKLGKPSNILSGSIRDPIAESRKNARKSLFEEKRTTGWRNF